MFLEIAIVVLLTLINGALAMSELAIVSARPARLKLLADIDMGVTAGVALPLGVGSVVVLITYLSLIVGELVPKQIALRAPEHVAARVASPMQFIARIAAPLIWVLDRSGKLVLMLLGQSHTPTRRVTDEEVRLIISEAESSGAMNRVESQMIAGVMRIADRTARGLMTPRHEVETLDASFSKTELLRQIHDKRRSRLPVREGDADNIIGVLITRDILGPAFMQEPFDLRGLLLHAPVVRDGQSALEVIDRLRTSPAHLVLVYDEYGHFEGIITPMDVLEAIAGDFPEDSAEEPKFVRRDDGSFIISGWMPVDEFADLLSIEIDVDRDYETVAGLVLHRLGRIPVVGERLRMPGWIIEVIDLDGRRIDKLLVSPENEH